jgi:hypothetical protein
VCLELFCLGQFLIGVVRTVQSAFVIKSKLLNFSIAYS